MFLPRHWSWAKRLPPKIQALTAGNASIPILMRRLLNSSFTSKWRTELVCLRVSENLYQNDLNAYRISKHSRRYKRSRKMTSMPRRAAPKIRWTKSWPTSKMLSARARRTLKVETVNSTTKSRDYWGLSPRRHSKRCFTTLQFLT